jgi:hypothetical protein
MKEDFKQAQRTIYDSKIENLNLKQKVDTAERFV